MIILLTIVLLKAKAIASMIIHVVFFKMLRSTDHPQERLGNTVES
jgi:hypothetical protein